MESEKVAPRSPSSSHEDRAVHSHVAGDFASQRLSRSPSPKRAVNRPAVTPPSIRDAPRCIEEKPTLSQGRRCRRTSSTMRRLPLRRRDLSRMFPRPRHDPGGITELSTCPPVTTADTPHGLCFFVCCDVSAEVRSPPRSHLREHAAVLAPSVNSDVAEPKLVVEASMYVLRKRPSRGSSEVVSAAAPQRRCSHRHVSAADPDPLPDPHPVAVVVGSKNSRETQRTRRCCTRQRWYFT